MTDDEQNFLEQAERELAELMAEASQSDLRHGPKRRTLDQDRALLDASLEALRLDCEVLEEELEALRWRELEQEEEAEPTPGPADEAQWLRAARKELAELVREIEGDPRTLPKRKAL